MAPICCFGPAGDFVVVWAGAGQEDASGIFGRRYDSGGNPLGVEFQVNTYAMGSQVAPSVASDASGNFVVVWDSIGQDGDSSGVFAQRYDSAGNSLGNEFQVNTETQGTQTEPSVASDATGGFVVVWESYDGSSLGVFGQRYDANGGPLGGEFPVNTHTTNYQRRPAVASDSVGNFVVIWHSNDQDGDGWGVFGQKYDNGGDAVGGEFQVNTYTTGFQVYPSVAADSTGNFVVVWYSSSEDGSFDGVFGQRYGRDGNPLGGEFQVNTYTTSAQNGPSVASNADGTFVVVWESYYSEHNIDCI